MASFTWQALIDRARTYVDDDHADENSWITPERWLQLANVEYALLYKRWIRSGLVTPAITQSYMNGNTRTFTGVLAVVGVAKDYGDFVRMLSNAAQGNNQPFWRGSTQPTDLSVSWAATGVGDSITIELDPQPSDLEYTLSPEAGNYIVRYVPTVAYATDASTTIELPYGTDERLVLGMARRAHVKDSGASALLERLIGEADAETNFSATSKAGGIVVKRKPKRSPLSTPRQNIWPERSAWLYI